MLLGKKREEKKKKSLLFTMLRTKPNPFSAGLPDSEKHFVASIIILGFPCFTAAGSLGSPRGHFMEAVDSL